MTRVPKSKSNAEVSSARAGGGSAPVDAWRTHEITFTGQAIQHFDQEWTLTNGSGAYAMGTVPGVNTRRYHGLLVASARPPVARAVLLSQMLEQLTLTFPDGQHRLELNTCMFHDQQDVFAPQGYTYLTRFEKGLSVAWTYAWRLLEYRRELYLHWKEQAATIRYLIRWTGSTLPSKAVLRLSPMLALRDFHAMTHQHAGGEPTLNPAGDSVTVTRGDLSATVLCPRVRFEPGATWWHKLYYPIEQERGQEAREDNFIPGAFVASIDPKRETELLVTVALGDRPAALAAAGNWSPAPRIKHLTPILDHIDGKSDPIKRMLAMASDDFIVDRVVKGQPLATIIAGYPWFADWGRDTFIAMSGLMLETGRYEDAKGALRVFAQAISGGLVPNRFDDYQDQAAHYNTVDGSLWFIESATRYVDASGDRESWDDWLCAACVSIIDAYVHGTDFGIRMAGDCLITAGSPQTQLTWMDAACNGVIFTPRHGKAVEINALWYNALLGMSERLAESNKKLADHYEKLADRVRRAFIRVFWDDERQRLCDTSWVDDRNLEHRDTTLRPNQVFAISLPRSPLPLTRQPLVLKAVRDELLTPVGLRTLPPGDPNYHPHYLGGAFERDKAYHQGTVWPWLIGPYAEAVLRVGKFSDKAKLEARAAIEPLLDRATGDGLGHLHEIHDADPPYAPRGCIAQAWSVAEVLRVLRMIETGKAT